MWKEMSLEVRWFWWRRSVGWGWIGNRKGWKVEGNCERSGLIKGRFDGVTRRVMMKWLLGWMRRVWDKSSMGMMWPAVGNG